MSNSERQQQQQQIYRLAAKVGDDVKSIGILETNLLTENISASNKQQVNITSALNVEGDINVMKDIVFSNVGDAEHASGAIRFSGLSDKASISWHNDQKDNGFLVFELEDDYSPSFIFRNHATWLEGKPHTDVKIRNNESNKLSIYADGDIYVIEGQKKVATEEMVNNKFSKATAKIDNNTGTPSVTVTVNESGGLDFDFKNMKGEKGPAGPQVANMSDMQVITFAANNNYGIRTARDNLCQVGDSGQAFYYGYFKNVDIHTGNLNFSSDRRFKTNIKEVKETCLDKINKVNVKTFDYIEEGQKEYDESKNHIGFIAQEVEAAFPELKEKLVTTKDDSKNSGVEDRKFLKETKLIFVLWKAVQELSQEVEKLKRGE